MLILFININKTQLSFELNVLKVNYFSFSTFMTTGQRPNVTFCYQILIQVATNVVQI